MSYAHFSAVGVDAVIAQMEDAETYLGSGERRVYGFLGISNQLQEINSSDGWKLDGGVAALVQAMATYEANNPSFNPATATVMPANTTLQNAIAVTWHH
jgi:hypothetical protein